MHVVVLTESQRDELSRRAHAPAIAPRTRDRLEMVRLSDAGWSVPRIARHLRHHENTVRYWIKAFLARGFDGLLDRKPPGKRSALTPPMVDEIKAEIGKGTRTWTAGQVKSWVQETYGVTLSEGRLCFHMKRAGLTWQRTGQDLSHKQDPEGVRQGEAALRTLEKGGMPGWSTSATSTRRASR